MLRNSRIRNRIKNIRNIVILLMVIVIMIGIYRNIGRSRAENVIEIDVMAIDNYGYLEKEDFVLEAKQVDGDIYEIELPESINSKKINQIVKVTLEENILEIVENKVQLTQEQLENYQVNMEVVYDTVLIEKDEEDQINKILLSEKTEEERAQIEIKEETQTLYNKILRYEDEENNKLVEVKGYLPKDAQLKVEPVTQEQLTEIFGDAKIDVAYDIKIVIQNITQVPVDEANPDSPMEEIIEIIEIDPEDFGETCEVTIKDASIAEKSQVYHVKEDNTYEKVNVKDNTKENITFDAQHFSIYAVSSSSILDEIGNSTLEPGDNAAMLGASVSAEIVKTTYSGYDVYVYNVHDVYGSDIRVHFPTWTSANGQDDLATDWGAAGSAYQGTHMGNGTYHFRMNVSDHNNEEGTYITHIYVLTNTTTLVADFSTYIDRTPPTATSYEVKNVSKDGYDIYVYGVSDNKIGVDRVQFPTWTDKIVGGTHQDDLDPNWGDPGSISSGTNQGNGTWYFRVKVSDHNNERNDWYETDVYGVDEHENIGKLVPSVRQYIDGNNPTITLGANSNTTWAKSHSVTVTLADDYSGIASGASIKYGWSTSTTTEPTSYTTATLSYTAGTKNTTFTATTPSGLATNKYYLWVVPTTFTDVHQNSNTATVKSTGTFYIDNTAPTITLGSNSSTSWAKTKTVTVTLADSHSGLVAGSSIGIKYGWSTSTSTEPSSYKTATLTNSAGAASTSFTATTDGLLSGVEGKYYLWVVPVSSNYVKDRAGNSNSTTVKSTGVFWVDNKTPSQATYSAFYSADSSAYTSGKWTNKEVRTKISSTDGGSGITAIEYSADKSSWTALGLGISGGVKLESGSTTNYYGTENWSLRERDDTFYFRTKDAAGNYSSASIAYNIKYDLTAPTKPTYTAFHPADNVSYTSGTWTNYAVNTTISSTDTSSTSGVGSSGVKSIQYSTNGTSWSTFSFSAGALTQSGNTWSGTEPWGLRNRNNSYYFKAIDNAGNESTVSSSYDWNIKYDINAPTITVDTTSCTWRNSALSVKITAEDPVVDGISSGLSSSNSYQYYLSTSSTSLTTGSWTGDSWTAYTSGTAFNINPGISGTYYLFVKRVSDNAGNVSTSNGTNQAVSSVTYQRYGPYYFDYDKPAWSYVSKDIYYSTANDAGNDNYANKDRTVKITFKGTDATTNATSSLTSDAISVTVNGTAVANANKSLTTSNNTSKEITCTLTITGITGDGTLNVVIPANTLTDQATNKNVETTLTTSVNITIDNTSPGLTLAVTSPAAGYYKAGQVITITATYNENVYKEITSNTLIDTTTEAPAMTLKFGGAASKNTVSCTARSGNVFTYTYTIKGPTTTTGTDGDNGTMSISLATVYDAAGNAISATNVTTPTITNIQADTILPAVSSITANRTSPTNASSITYTVVFSESVTGFTADDVTVNSGKGSVTSVTGSGTTWSVVVSTTDNQEYTETITVKANGNTIDRAGNKVATAKTSTGLVIDRIDPTVTITANRTSPTNASSITYTFTFSEAVTGFTTDDITFTASQSKATKGTFTEISSTVYTLVVNTVDNVTETITVGLAAGKCVDKAQNGNIAATSSVIVADRIEPVWSYVSKDIYLTNSNDVGNDDYANADRTVKIVFKGTDDYSNATSSLTSDAITVSVNGTAVANSNKTLETVNNSSSEVTCTLTITGITGDGDLTVVIPANTLTDQATNKNVQTALTTDVNIDIDNTPPTVSLSVTSPAAGGYKAGQVVTITATYTENVYKEITSNNLIDTAAEAPAMSLKFGGTAAAGTVTCSSVNGKVITYTYTITDGDNGRLRISSLGTAYDAAGNAVSASNVTPTIAINADTTSPTIAVSPSQTTNSSASNYVKSQSITITANDPTVNSYASGLSGSNSYSWFLSESTAPTAVSTATGTYGTYTSGTAFTIGSNLTGTYYLYVKQVSDVVGNVSTTSGTMTTVGSDKYHRYGTYKFDNTNPTVGTMTMKLGSSTGDAYTNDTWTNQSVYIAVNNGSDAHSGHKSTTYTVLKNGAAYSSNQTGAQTLADQGTYTITVTTKDNLDNTSTSSTYTVKIDKTRPTITVSPTSKTWTNSAVSVTITHADEGGSELASLSGSYFLSTSSTPTAVATGSALSGTYTSGTAFNINPGISGEYYLFVKAISDNAANTSTATNVTVGGVTYHRYGLYQFDYDKPTITVSPTQTTNYARSLSVTITAQDFGGSGLLGSNSYTWFLAESSTPTAVSTATGTYGTYTNGSTFTIGSNLTGTYYLFVRQVGDVAGSVSETNGIMKTVSGTKYHMIGTYKFDNTNPYWVTQNFDVDEANKKVTVDLIGTDDHSGYRANTLDFGDIEVWVDGTKITNVTKHLSEATTVTEGIKYTLTLTNFEEATRQSGKSFKEWSGTTKIVIAADTLEDKSGYDYSVTGNKNTSQEFTLGHVDIINPEFTYEYANTTINHTNETVTIVFDVTDKFFASTTLSSLDTSQITVQVDDYDVIELNAEITKTLTKVKDIYYDKTAGTTYVNSGVTGTGAKVGERYQLVITGLDEEDGYKYSGYMTLAFTAGTITDTSGNTSSATSISIGKNEPDGSDSDKVVVDVVDPIWQLGDVDLEAGTIKLIAKDKYFEEVTIDEDDITVYVNGVASTAVVKDITSTTPTDILDTVNGVANTVVGKEYTLKLSNLIPEGGGYTTFTPTNISELVQDAEYKYRADNSGDISIKIAAGTITDKYENSSNESPVFAIGNIDSTKTEIFRVSSTKDATAKTETIIFNVTDRNYDPTDFITLGEILTYVDGIQVDTINKSNLTYKPIKTTLDNTEKNVGHQYTLVLSNFDETDANYTASGRSYKEWSGTTSIKIAEGAATDMGGNSTVETTITGELIDFIKPVIEKVSSTKGTNNETIIFNVWDKYLDTSDALLDTEITVKVDGEIASSITKDLTKVDDYKATVNGNSSHVVGQKYQLVLSGFEQSSKQTGKDFMEWSGTVTIEIAQNAVKDTSGNTLDSAVANRTITGDHVDFIKPVIESVSSTRGTNNETIVFNVIDKYLDTSDAVADTEIKVYVDNEEITITKALTKTATYVMNKTTKVTTTQAANYTVQSIEQVVGEKYQLVLSGFEQASRNAKEYKDWSGTVRIDVLADAVKDTSSNKNILTPVTGDFVDFIAPDIEYTHQSTDISASGKSYTMTFNITDKYIASNSLTLDDLTITMQNGQTDSSGNLRVYNLKDELAAGKIGITWDSNPAEIRKDFNKTTNVANRTIETVTNTLIGYTYTLTITNLEQLEIDSGETTLDYSGIVNVAITANQIQDSGPAGTGASPNGNAATTITSGVNIPGGTTPDDAEQVDVVKPLVEKVSSSAYAFYPNTLDTTKTAAQIKLRVTDTYLNSANEDASTLASDEIEVWVNGAKVSITPTISAATVLNEERYKNHGLGITKETVQYGVEYTVTLIGFTQNANQVKIKILEKCYNRQIWKWK